MGKAINATNWLLSQNSNFEDHFVPLTSDSEQKCKARRATTISITAGKGGVGKTTFALKFARELAAKNNKVLLIDCDYNLSNTSIKLGLPLSDKFLSLLSAEKTFDDCLYKDNNFHLLTGCNGNLDIFESKIKIEEIIIDIVYSHEMEYDYIILDCPAGIQRETLTLNAYTDHRFFIVTPDRSSITDSYSLIKILKQKFGIQENHLIVNRYDNNNQFQRVVTTISETVENFLGCRTYILGGIPKCDCLIDKFDSIFLYDANSTAHKNFLKLLKMFTERWGRPVFDSLNMELSYPHRDDFEQNVHEL